MGSKTNIIDELIKDLQTAGYSVVSVGARYRVTNPAGGDPAFLPKSPPRSGAASTKAGLAGLLAKIGYTAEEAETVRQLRRDELMRAGREAEALALAKAQRDADARQSSTTTTTTTTTATAPKAVRQRKGSSAPPAPAGPITTMVMMTAEYAQYLLSLNKFFDKDRNTLDTEAGSEHTNRPFSATLANRWKRVMLRGEWRLTHQGIAIDSNNLLVDGQHRLVGFLLACEEQPGLTIPLMVTTGLAPEAYDMIDIGKKRSIGDFLGSYGVTSSSGVAAVLRLVVFYDESRAPSTWGMFSLTPAQARRVLAEQPALTEATRWGLSRPLALPAAEGAARHLILRACSDQAQPAALAFFDAYRSGQVSGAGDPILTVRNVLINQIRERKRKRFSLEQMALIIKAWNAHAAGRPQKVLAWRDTEPVPRVASPQ